MDDGHGRRVAVTGGRGFVGGRLVTQLHDRGFDVTVLHRPGRGGPSADLPGRHRPVDLQDPARVRAALAGAEILVHLAARSGGIQFQQTVDTDVFLDNQRATRGVLEAAHREGVARVLIASSAVVYAPHPSRPILETAPCVTPFRDRVSGYAWSKLTDEMLATWYADTGAFEVMTARFTGVYGPGGSFDPDRSTVVHSLVRRATEAGSGGLLEVWGSGDAVRSFLHVDDAARALVAILLRGSGGEAYNVDASEPVTIRRLATLVRDAVDPSLHLVFDPDRPEGAPHRVLDTFKLRALGFAPQVDLVTGVRATAAAYPAGTR